MYITNKKISIVIIISYNHYESFNYWSNKKYLLYD